MRHRFICYPLCGMLAFAFCLLPARLGAQEDLLAAPDAAPAAVVENAIIAQAEADVGPVPVPAAAPDEEAPPDSEWYYGNSIKRIEFEGLRSVREQELRGVTDQYIGRPFSDALLEDLQRRLYALDFFADLIPRAERVLIGPAAANEMILVFAVSENPLIISINFEGNTRLGNALLRDTVLVKPNDVIIDADLRADAATLERFYRSRGFPNAQVSHRIETYEGDDSRREVYFDIAEGQQEIVRDIVFQGNFAITDNVLRGIMQTKMQSLFNRGELSASQLQQDQRLIKEHYQSQGYINAEVLDVTRTQIEDEDESRIFYTIEVFIEEGAQYTLGEVEFRGNQIYSDDELRESFRMRPGDVLNLSRFENDFQSAVSLYFDNGYIFNSIEKIETPDVENKIISYVIVITERPRAHIETISIRGNTKTKDSVILRELPFAEGEVFSAANIRQGVLNLYNLQYFGNILPETPPGSADGLMELILNVEEGQTADIRFGLAFGGNPEFPVALQVGWQDRNFLGNGHSFGADLSVSLATQQLDITFTEPWLGNERLSLRTDLALSRTDVSGVPQDILAPIFGDEDTDAVPDPYTGAYVFPSNTTYNGTSYNMGEYFPGAPTDAEIEEYNLQTDYEFAGGDSGAPISEEYLLDYVLWAAQLGVGIGYRIPTEAGLVRLGTSISTRIESVDYTDAAFRPHDPLLRNGLDQITLINRLSLRAALDSRDLFYNPTSGYYVGQVLTLAGGFLFGDRHYIRSDTRGEFHLTLVDVPVGDEGNFKLVLGIQSLFSAIFPHFFVPAEFRNRAQPVATRQERLYIDGVFYGRGWPQELDGEALWDSIIELRIPVIERIFWLDFFFEGASLWTDLDMIAQKDLLENMRFTFGGGVRFTIPQFPIRLYLAKRFRVVNGQVEWQTSPLFNADNVAGGGIDFVFSIGADLF